MSVKVTMAFCKNVWTRMMHFENQGDKNEPHRHDFDHITLLASGSVKATVEDRESVYHAPVLILTEAQQYHHFEALEDNTVLCCIQAFRDSVTGEIIEPDMVVGYKGGIMPFSRPDNFQFDHN